MVKNKKLKSTKISATTQLGAFMEHIDEKVTLTAEHVSGLTKKVEGIDKKLTGLDEKVENLDIRMGRIEKTQEYHSEMIGNLAINVEVIKTDVEFMKSSLKRKVDVEEFEALTKRVSLLESRFLKH